LKFSKVKNRYIFYIKGKYKKSIKRNYKFNNIDISINQYKKDQLKIIISSKYNMKSPYYVINKDNIIIKLSITNQNIKSVKKIDNTNKIIVIDPGHGGKDVGAVGVKYKYEKEVVLKVSKYLYNILKKRGYKVYLTRHKDVFIKVNNRTNLSNIKKADIFLSIHANAAPKNKRHKLNGIETFFLSPNNSERSKRVAEFENKGDIRTMNFNTKNTLLNILNQSKITQSNKLAIDIHKHILNSVNKKYKNVKDGGVREGPFWVLVGAQMPSVLIEVGYISHKTERKRLFNTEYQKLLANGIANGISEYFSKN
jgi:N-acetylmuramoyl-L-alanine amidase